MSADTETLSRRAVAAWTELGLGWMPGMLDVEGFRHVGESVAWTGPARGHAVTMTGAQHPPDLTDFATLGCIEHGMLPKAWGPGYRIDMHRHHDGSAEVVVRSGYLDMVAWESGLIGSVGEALVACLEAAAERRRQR